MTAAGAATATGAAGTGSLSSGRSQAARDHRAASPLARRRAQRSVARAWPASISRDSDESCESSPDAASSPAPPTGREAGPRWCGAGLARRFGRGSGRRAAESGEGVVQDQLPGAQQPRHGREVQLQPGGRGGRQPGQRQQGQQDAGGGELAAGQGVRSGGEGQHGECHHGRAQGVEGCSGGCAHGTLPSPAAAMVAPAGGSACGLSPDSTGRASKNLGRVWPVPGWRQSVSGPRQKWQSSAHSSSTVSSSSGSPVSSVCPKSGGAVGPVLLQSHVVS